MQLKLYYREIRWNRNELTIVGAFLSNGRKNFQVDGLKRVIMPKEKLYLCRVWETTGNHRMDTFKFFVLDNITIKNFKMEDIQLVGMNIGGRFCFDSKFGESMTKDLRADSVPKIDLGERVNVGETDRKSAKGTGFN
jgi:hypothetical protein